MHHQCVLPFVCALNHLYLLISSFTSSWYCFTLDLHKSRLSTSSLTYQTLKRDTLALSYVRVFCILCWINRKLSTRGRREVWIFGLQHFWQNIYWLFFQNNIFDFIRITLIKKMNLFCKSKVEFLRKMIPTRIDIAPTYFV